ncbi:Hpt domain-containing protein [Devosia algicola]|uniref:Hpt domain-containing protein n=1 Tax=Devosia algicola TaxID=3026418 RepID=A0ABY7YRA0_9HYPH|nr:Hpt domain-containing protein [Devosia algicola]WDR03784.1 Hpt domain-containing protein [Devosia algicola]
MQTSSLEVLAMFDETIQAYMARLRGVNAVSDYAPILHTLKGAAAGVGAVGIATLARQAEQALKDGLPPQQEAIDDIGIAVEEVRAFIATQIVDLDD